MGLPEEAPTDPLPRAKGKGQTRTLRIPEKPGEPCLLRGATGFTKAPSPHVHNLSVTDWHSQNKTATYLWPFIPSSVTETHILTHFYHVPKITWISFLYKAVKKWRWELSPYEEVKSITPNLRTLKFWCTLTSTLHQVFRDLVSTRDVILLIQYRTNDKGKSGKQWPFINEFSDSPKPEELPTTVIYIYIHTQPRPHVHPKYIDVIYPLPIFCIYVRGVISLRL